MYRVLWARYDEVVDFADFDSEHEAEIVFDFITGIFDTNYAKMFRRNDTNGWKVCNEYGEMP